MKPQRILIITAALSALIPPAVAFEPDIIIDDADTTHVEFSGSWAAETNVTKAFRGGSKVTTGTATSSNEYARFHTTLPRTGPWKVFLWHNGLGGTSFADDPSLTLLHSDPAPSTVTWNSRSNAGEWRMLGVFWFDAGTEAEVKLTHNDTGKISADAVRFSFSEPEAVVEASTSATDVSLHANSTQWPFVTENSGFNQSTRRSATSGATATFTPVIPAAGWYDASVWIPQSNGAWIPGGGTMAAAIPIDVYYRGGVASLSVSIPTTGANEGGWVRIGTGPFLLDATPPAGQPNPNPAKIVIKTTGTTGEYVPADAVRFVKVGTYATLMDNDDPAGPPGVTANPSPGSWAVVAQNLLARSWDSYKYQPFGPDALHATYTSNNTLTYTPALPELGLYDVYLWYRWASGNSQQTLITVNSPLGVISRTVDQRSDAGQWTHAGRYILDPVTAWLKVATNAAAGTYTVADGVMFLRDGEEKDLDGDGLPDWRERLLGTDTYDENGGQINGNGGSFSAWDTDGDGISDGDEYRLGLDPLIAATVATQPEQLPFTVFTPASSTQP